MDKETAKAINNVSNKVNELIKQVNELYSRLCAENAENIASTDAHALYTALLTDTLIEEEE